MARPLNAGVAGPMTGQMEGLMMVTPLTLGELIIPRAEELFGHRAVIARTFDRLAAVAQRQDEEGPASPTAPADRAPD